MKRNIRWVRNRWDVIFSSIFFIVFLFFIVLEKKTITKLEYENTALEDELKKERVIGEGLSIEISELSSPERIEALAKSYGLINITTKQIVFIKDVDVGSEKSKMEEHQGFLAMLFKKNVSAAQK